ncbi:pentatricopeptide repeat-containing protein At1g15510, chloroplastic-like isoform X2 [Phalaenopsis equestris]|uniref:pentatricopeptide repeat-containing protein At1g15510, chloroplastic-like isoform X2 n=1 Tax=Phalaenopsis equestris TaxID=78828 RepID=UPI0009E44E48|nr:pentatricopeptide repeat-containing protein At1g15510, chloroplastic-like isoform X2 [Phalaenopsis equestris]
MLRSIVRTFFSCCTNPPFFLLNPVVRSPCGGSSRFKIMKSCSYRGGVSNTGSMADVLEIIGPLENFLSSDAIIYVTLLRKCIRCKNFLIGKLVLAHLVKLGFKSELLVSNVLLDVCCKAGFLDDGLKLFDEMPQRDLISWCTIISGFVSHGFDLKAYSVFIGMLQSGLKPNHFVTSSVLKASAAAGIPELGVLVHCLATKCGLGFDRFVEVGLVCMYAKCGFLNDAIKLFYEIPVKSSVSWNAIISGCIQNGYLMEAVKISLEMCQIGFRMDLVTLRIVMSAASALEMFDFCKLLHVYSIKLGFDTDSFLVAEFVRLLAMLGEVSYMSELFNVVKRPDVSLYALLISGYHLHGCREEALKLVEELFAVGLKPTEGYWITILNICASKEEGNQILALILKIGFLSSISVGNALISMYIRCADMIEAYGTFLKIEERDTVTWTAIMAGLTHNLQYREALLTFQDFRKTKLQPDEQCLATAVNACTGLKAIYNGKKIHALAVKQGVEICKFIIASILHMYAKCSYIGSAVRLFSLSSASYACDLILTNIMLAGYCWNSLPLMALELFKRESQSGLIPDQFTISTLLGACADLNTMTAGEQIHCCVVKIGFEFSDIFVQNAIVNMYLKSGNIANACKFYYFMRRKNIILYEMLMAGYLRQKGGEEALILLSDLRRSFLCSCLVAFAMVLRASANFFELQKIMNMVERKKDILHLLVFSNKKEQIKTVILMWMEFISMKILFLGCVKHHLFSAL